MSESGNGTVIGAVPAVGRQLQLNPERAPALIAKYQKMIGKDLEQIKVVYTQTGVDVYVLGKGDLAKKSADGKPAFCSLTEFKEAKARASQPSSNEKAIAFRNKFEIRLNKPFPDDHGMTDTSDSAIQAFLSKRSFNERRAMLMSNKQFKAAYPNGFQ